MHFPTQANRYETFVNRAPFPESQLGLSTQFAPFRDSICFGLALGALSQDLRCAGQTWLATL